MLFHTFFQNWTTNEIVRNPLLFGKGVQFLSMKQGKNKREKEITEN